MRRIDREIKDEKLIEAFITKEQIMRIAFYDNGEIYIVPVNYGYSNDSGKTEWQYSEEMLSRVAVFRVDVEKMSCKAK